MKTIFRDTFIFHNELSWECNETNKSSLFAMVWSIIIMNDKSNRMLLLLHSSTLPYSSRQQVIKSVFVPIQNIFAKKFSTPHSNFYKHNHTIIEPLNQSRRHLQP